MTFNRSSRIYSLIHTSVDDCRATIQLVGDPDLLQAVLAEMDRNGIEGKSRRQVIERRIRQIKREARPCA